MNKDDRDVIEALRTELDFVEKGGYGRSVRTPWKSTSVFQDSIICLNYEDPARPHPCKECFLIDFVPPEHRSDNVPCHHIPLRESGESVADFQRGNGAEMEDALKNWLRRTIDKLEAEKVRQGLGSR